jgi:DNA polymerase zeta
VDPQAIQTESAAHRLILKYKSCGLPPLCDIQLAETEAQLFQLFIKIVGQADPDFFIGYDINRNSFGFLVKRGKVININLLQLLSKVPNEPPNFRNNTGEEEDSMYGQGEPSILITGRILLNLWNYMRSELKLMSYTYMR